LILPPPQQPQPMDPSMEHIQAMTAKPFQAFLNQDHKAHIDAHLNFMGTVMVKNNPQIAASLQKNILEHITLMAQEQIQLEFAQEMVQMQQMQAQLQQNPQLGPQIENLMVMIESRKAKLIAEMTKDYMEEENSIFSDVNDDPLTKLKRQELDLRARENERKGKEAEEKLEIDRAKLLQDQMYKDEKLEQEDEHAQLRAGISLAKMGVQNMKIMSN